MRVFFFFFAALLLAHSFPLSPFWNGVLVSFSEVGIPKKNEIRQYPSFKIRPSACPETSGTIQPLKRRHFLDVRCDVLVLTTLFCFPMWRSTCCLSNCSVANEKPLYCRHLQTRWHSVAIGNDFGF